jgi:septal ring factor EnvC (AmiA/AmiB activator)
MVIANLGKGENNILYFEIRCNNIPDDPLLWLKP